ncbi:MAG TPA: energy transducer TonB [Bacteroidia bacterium]|nr:energy transducer TonB [Bacteroidia bacterium]
MNKIKFVVLKGFRLSLFIMLLTSMLASCSVACKNSTQPQFTGHGLLENFIKENIIYPEDAVNNSIAGKVKVQFIVEKDGTVSGTKVLEGVHKLLDDEAVRIVNLTTWTPGNCNGKPIRTKLILPVNFKLE